MGKMGLWEYILTMSLIALALIGGVAFFAFQGKIWAIVIITVLGTLFVMALPVGGLIAISEYTNSRNRAHMQNDLGQDVRLLGNMSRTMLNQNKLLNQQVQQNLLGSGSEQSESNGLGFDFADEVDVIDYEHLTEP